MLDVPHEGENLRAGWAAVAMRSVLEEGAAGGRSGTYEFRIDGEAFHLRIGEEGEKVPTLQGPAQDPDLVVTGEAETFLAVASGRLGLEEAMDSGSLQVEGDREALLASAKNKG